MWSSTLRVIKRHLIHAPLDSIRLDRKGNGHNPDERASRHDEIKPNRFTSLLNKENPPGGSNARFSCFPRTQKTRNFAPLTNGLRRRASPNPHLGTQGTLPTPSHDNIQSNPMFPPERAENSETKATKSPTPRQRQSTWPASGIQQVSQANFHPRRWSQPYYTPVEQAPSMTPHKRGRSPIKFSPPYFGTLTLL